MKILEGQRGKRASESDYTKFTHKKCSKCENIKPVDKFYRKKTKTARGWAWDSKCIKCRRVECQKYGKSNRLKRNKRLRDWRKANPKKARANDHRGRLKHKYGLSPDDVEKMRSDQGGRCAICNVPSDRLFIDHCHQSGKVRKLLCQKCNTLLGWYEARSPLFPKFQQYIDDHQ